MELIVRFRTATDTGDEELGLIVWDGYEFSLQPDNDTMRYILGSPVSVDDRDVSSADEPELWLRNLYRQYKSVALRASEAVPLTDADFEEA